MTTYNLKMTKRQFEALEEEFPRLIVESERFDDDTINVKVHEYDEEDLMDYLDEQKIEYKLV